MADIAADKAELIALFVEALLYGIFVVLFYQSIRILTDLRTGPKINWPLLVTSVGIFATASGHLAIILRRALEAFIDDQNGKGGPVGYYGNLRSALEVGQASCQVAVGMLGDGMAVYRVFVVYNRNYIAIILPMISLGGTIAASIGSVIVIGQASTRSSAFYFPRLETWMPIFFGLTFCTSIICTGLISVRLWYVNRKVATFASGGRRKIRRLIAVQRIIIESATMYSAIMFVYLVTYLAKTNYSIIFGDMVAPVIGIVFSLITIRVNDAFAAQGSTGFTKSTHPSTNPHSEMGHRNAITLDISRTAESFSDQYKTGTESQVKSEGELQ